MIPSGARRSRLRCPCTDWARWRSSRSSPRFCSTADHASKPASSSRSAVAGARDGDRRVHGARGRRGPACGAVARRSSSRPGSARERRSAQRGGPVSLLAQRRHRGRSRSAAAPVPRRRRDRQHDMNIGSVVRNANAFLAAEVHIIGRRRWNKRGAMVTDRYQHMRHHGSIDEFVAWARTRNYRSSASTSSKGRNRSTRPSYPALCPVAGQEGPTRGKDAERGCRTSPARDPRFRSVHGKTSFPPSTRSAPRRAGSHVARSPRADRPAAPLAS